MAGITDLYAKVEGSLNMQHITKAFMLGLLRQKTHQVMADEKKLHLVEMRAENEFFPKVINEKLKPNIFTLSVGCGKSHGWSC